MRISDWSSDVCSSDLTGTGKELAALAIHRHSARSERPFVVINCGAIPQTLVQSELFGYERGAFTGATQRKLGRIEMANGGTRSEEHTSELQSLMRISYRVYCLKKKTNSTPAAHVLSV